jgi:hypothetical protein
MSCYFIYIAYAVELRERQFELDLQRRICGPLELLGLPNINFILLLDLPLCWIFLSRMLTGLGIICGKYYVHHNHLEGGCTGIR